SLPYLGKTFLRTVRALIDVHGEEMILRDGDERLTLNIRHDTSCYSNQPQKESINLINVFNYTNEDFLEDLFSTNQPSGNPTFSSYPELTSPEVKDDIFDLEGGNSLPYLGKTFLRTVRALIDVHGEEMILRDGQVKLFGGYYCSGIFSPITYACNYFAGNAPDKSSYANVTSKPSRKKVNVHTLLTPGGNGIDVVVLVDYIRAISERFAITAYGFFLGRRWHTLSLLTMSSYARVMIALRADVELKDNIVMAMPKITREGHYTCNVCVNYDWRPPRCSCCKVFRQVYEECPKNTGVGEKKTVKNPVKLLEGFQLKGMEPTLGVSNSNPFDFFNSVDNDEEFGTNSSNTPIGEKIEKIKRQICKGKLKLLDIDKNPLVPTGIVETNSEVEVVFDETANFRILTSGKDRSDKGYDTNILLGQWRDSYPDNDDYDLYDDDMYKNHDMSEHLQSICDDLDITVHGRK
nr:hypothetical protein [Tanacetum cinerariifolium]